jgi:hypothetical protein
MKLHINKSDDPQFAGHVVQIVNAVLQAEAPNEVRIIKLDNWFGPKWLMFSHKVMGAFGVSSRDLVVPPFVPNRIISELAFIRHNSAIFVSCKPQQAVHITQASEANAARKISQLFPHAAMFWWSGNSETNINLARILSIFRFYVSGKLLPLLRSFVHKK